MQQTKKTQRQQTSKRDSKETRRALGKYTRQVDKERKNTKEQTNMLSNNQTREGVLEGQLQVWIWRP